MFSSAIRNRLLAAVSLVLLGLVGFSQTFVTGFGQPQIGAVQGNVRILRSVQVVNYGTIIFEGKMDVNPTVRRIRNGIKLNYNNDGSVFSNRERLLPYSSDSSYYREFVHAMPGFPFPGPQRLVIGKNGKVYYTGDHYDSFYSVN